MSNTDGFIEEVSEEVRKDKLFALYKKYGWIPVVIICSLVGGAGFLRMSGASGKVPSAIHMTPEAALGGPIAQLRDGDVVTIDAVNGAMTTDAPLADREPITSYKAMSAQGFGRGLFASYRQNVCSAEQGAGLKLI